MDVTLKSFLVNFVKKNLIIQSDASVFHLSILRMFLVIPRYAFRFSLKRGKNIILVFIIQYLIILKLRRKALYDIISDKQLY